MESKMKTVLMIYPKTSLDKVGNSVCLPLSIMHTTSLIPQDKFRVKLIDQRVQKDWQYVLEKELLNENLLCVGISTMTGNQITWAIKAAEIIRDKAPKVPIVWGGVHPTLYPEQTSKQPLVYIMVINKTDF